MPAPTLNTYMQEVQKFLRDTRQDLLDPGDIIDNINTARREVAMRAQCIRRLTPISGSLISATVTNGGSGYSAPVVAISAPDFPSGTAPSPNGAQATALAIVQAGTITGIDIQFGGYGYFQPQLTITDPTGSGAAATVSLSFINQLNETQECYPFSAIDLSMFPGCESVYMIKSASIIYSNYRYSLPMYSFSVYQARIRQYSSLYQWVPTFASQYGQGTSGSLYMYPIPSQQYQLELDCFCMPSDLVTDLSVEAIPQPWTDAVKFYASHLCYLQIQNANYAMMYQKLFNEFVTRYGSYARPGRATNLNGRW